MPGLDGEWPRVAESFVIVQPAATVRLVDPLTHFLDGPRATRAFAVCLEMSGAWGIRIEDGAALTLLVVVAGEVVVDAGEGPTTSLSAGDLALVRGPEPYVVADRWGTGPTIRIGAGQQCTTTDGRDLREEFSRGIRRWGTAEATGRGRAGPDDVVLVGIYEQPHEIGGLLARALPPLVVETGDGSDDRPDAALLGLLRREIETDDPAGQVVIDRLLDLLVVGVVRRWAAASERIGAVSGLTSADPIVGGALRLLHADPAADWTVADLARRLHVSRASLAARFRTAVGEPPMAYLTRWRMTLATDRLLEPAGTVAGIARDVGYDNAFAFSTAFKRQIGMSPSDYRRRHRK